MPPSPKLRQRERDFWTVYVARTILGKKPDTLPDVKYAHSEDVPVSLDTVDEAVTEEAQRETDTADKVIVEENQRGTATVDLGLSSLPPPPTDTSVTVQMCQDPSAFYPTADIPESDQKYIDLLVQKYLTSDTVNDPRIVTTLLSLCDEDEQRYPYDIIVTADRIMAKANGARGLRIADNVCKELMNIFKAMTKGQITMDQSVPPYGGRFSLRRVFLRLCKDANYFPTFLLLKDIVISADKLPASGGSNGDVYQVPSPLPQCPGLLALKRFRISLKKTVEAMNLAATKFLFEVFLWSFLKHDNILEFYGLHIQRYDDIEVPFVVSPWMVNEGVSTYLKSHEAEPTTRKRWIQQLASALCYLHDECIVHGDLHGENILIDEKFNVRVADFGLSRLAEMTQTADLSLIKAQGAPWWAAPESLADSDRPQARYPADVWAFGCACLLIWTGSGPYSFCKGTFKVYEALNTKPQSPEGPIPMNTFHKDLPEGVAIGTFLREEIAFKCWDRDANNRPKMKELHDILQENLETPLTVRSGE